MKHSNRTSIFAGVTGATGAIGKAIARNLAEDGYHVYLLIRDAQKGEKAVQDIINQTGNQHVKMALVDTSRKTSVQELRDSWEDPLHILINNAAIAPRSRQETPEGIELQFATNVLGYFWMTRLFQPVLAASGKARVINVASYWAGGLDLDDLEFERRSYRNGLAYRQSKQADRMLTAAFAKRYDPQKITVNACHPGDVNSTLSNDLGFGGSDSPNQGAATPVWLATEPIGREVTGGYFEHKSQTRCPFMENEEAVETLFKICQEY
jgi:NAD(P)-dependent dehydrogenase (short-subunit alcohol dehydrogenase family)